MRISFHLVMFIAATAVASLVAWTWPPAGPPSVGDVQRLMPRGGQLRGLVRLEATGAPPLETAAVAVVPRFPGAVDTAYYGVVVAYDPWRRRAARVYAEPLPGPIPLSPDAARIGGRREAAIFHAMRPDGTRVHEVVAFTQGRWRRLNAPASEHLLAAVPDAPPGITWRFRARNGVISAPSRVLRVQVRQPVRIVASGGGPTPIIVPDARLDIIEPGYRARDPGTYTIRILLPFNADQGYTLTLVVESP